MSLSKSFQSGLDFLKQRSTGFKVLISLLFILFVWSFLIEPNCLIVKNITIENKNLSGLKIAVAGDFHLKKHDEWRLKKAVKLLNQADADIILLVGDYVNGISRLQTLSFDKITANLSQLTAKNGVYAIIGNHDIWLDENKVKNALIDAKITVLDNENKKININGKNYTLAGTNDFTESKADLPKTLKNAENPIILMTHNPDIFELVPSNVDVTISGHTHGGQVVLPFIGALVVPSAYENRYASGLVVENNRTIFITKGIGTSILPVRFNCLPEIVVITFK